MLDLPSLAAIAKRYPGVPTAALVDVGAESTLPDAAGLPAQLPPA
jgi:hypothetical protein